MEVTKSKKTVRSRVIKSANSPLPEMNSPICGHSGCGMSCNVRYVGPTSHIRDHHMVHAAKGVTHIWTATIVTGFALVLTGAIALNSAQAGTRNKAMRTENQVSLKAELEKVNTTLSEMQVRLDQLTQQCAAKQ